MSRWPTIREWERGFLEYLHAQYPQVGERLRKEKEISKELEAELKRGDRRIQGAARRRRSRKQAPAKRGQATPAR